MDRMAPMSLLVDTLSKHEYDIYTEDKADELPFRKFVLLSATCLENSMTWKMLLK